MAVGTFTLYNSGKHDLFDRTIDWVGSTTIKAILCTTTYTPAATHATYTDITNECADGDYAPVTLTGMSITESSGTIKWDANQVDYGAAVTISARYIVLVESVDGTLSATDPLIGYMDLNDGGTNVSSTNSDFKVDWNAANGLFTV